jgi:dTDP-L-rhamnose 4-epimerase
MAERVLVTGGAGFIGSHTVDLLLDRGYEVRVLDSLEPRVHPKGKPDYLPEQVELVVGDAADRRSLGAALEGVDYVVHLAAYQDYLLDFARFIHTNTESSALLFELIVEQRRPVRKVVFASSQSVAGEGQHRCPEHGPVWPDLRPVEQLQQADWEVHCPVCNEPMQPQLISESVVRPHTAYAISKYAIELLARSLGARYGIPTACMRYTYVQGARNSFYNAFSGVCRIFALRILNGRPPVCFEDGEQLRDYVNVKDVALANVLAMEETGDHHRVYNVGGARPITVRQFAKIVLDTCGSSLEPSIPGLFRMGDTRHTVSDVSEIRRLGWQPTIPVEQNVREYLAWMSRYRGTSQYLEEADRVMHEQNIVRSVV